MIAGRSYGGTRLERIGSLPDGTPIDAITLTSGHGVTARVLTYGATLQTLVTPDREGRCDDILLGHDDLASYAAHRGFFGVTVGRYANRIAHGRFALDGVEYQLERNDGAHALHGGTCGLDTIVWRIASIGDDRVPGVVLTHISPEGSAGYPGELAITVTYTLDAFGTLTTAFAARTTRPTIVNMTNHAVFNLGGPSGSAGLADHLLTVPASAYTPVDADLIPTGEIRAVDGVFDLRRPRAPDDCWKDGASSQTRIARGYNHNFVLDKGRTASPELAARLVHAKSGRFIEVHSAEPGLQAYTSNHLDGTRVGKGGQRYAMGDGIALEAQAFPDAPNHAHFPTTRVDPETPYRHIIEYRTGVVAD